MAMWFREVRQRAVHPLAVRNPPPRIEQSVNMSIYTYIHHSQASPGTHAHTKSHLLIMNLYTYKCPKDISWGDAGSAGSQGDGDIGWCRSYLE
jgi:hypothetical protein